jgi:hypothetical protein
MLISLFCVNVKRINTFFKNFPEPACWGSFLPAGALNVNYQEAIDLFCPGTLESSPLAENQSIDFRF